jgi:hypothetical protein
MPNPNQKLNRAAVLRVGGNLDWNEVDDDWVMTAQDIDYVLNECTIPASGKKTVTLPPCGSAPGRQYLFLAVVDLGGDGFEVQNPANNAFVAALDYETAGNGMTAVGDYVIVEDCGKFYRQVAAVLT